jgi:hypothetical protein
LLPRRKHPRDLIPATEQRKVVVLRSARGFRVTMGHRDDHMMPRNIFGLEKSGSLSYIPHFAVG